MEIPGASPITPKQWQKVLKALCYSFGSGFAAGFSLAVTGALSGLVNGGSLSVNTALIVALVAGGLVGAFNSIAVTIKQLFTPGE